MYSIAAQFSGNLSFHKNTRPFVRETDRGTLLRSSRAKEVKRLGRSYLKHGWSNQKVEEVQ